MEKNDNSIMDFIQGRKLRNILENVKILVKKKIPSISIDSLMIEESPEGNLIEVPRWAAEIFLETGFAEIQEENFEIRLLQTLSRERIQSSNHLSELSNHFHIKLVRYLEFLNDKIKNGEISKSDYDEIYLRAHDLITLRTAKILPLTVGEYSPELLKKLSPEEINLFNIVRNSVQQWKYAVLEGLKNE